MTTERSHGKARTVLATSGSLRVIDAEQAERDRTRGRDARGRFRAGNNVGAERGVNRDVKRLFGRLVKGSLDECANDAVSTAYRLFKSIMRTMPSSAAIVRTQVASACWHTALAGHWRTVALEAGLDTAKGIEADERATRHDLRSERLLVSALDLAQRLPRPAPAIPAWWVAPAPATPAQREPTSTVEDAHQDVDDPDDGADDLADAVTRLRGLCGGRPAPTVDDDEGAS